MRILTLYREYFSMAWDALRSHKMRSFLTTLGILIGVTTIITIWTTIEGLNQYVYGQLSNIGSSSIYVEKFPWVITGDFWKYRNRKEVNWKEFQAVLKQVTLASHVAPEVFSIKKVEFKKIQLEGVFIIGSSEAYTFTSSVYPVEGRFITEQDVSNNRFVTVLGSELAKRLFDKENAVGKRIKIDNDVYLVIGVLEKKGNFFGQSMDDYAVVPIGTFRRVYGMHRGLRISVMTDYPEQIEDLKDEVRGVMRKERKLHPSAEDDFSINQQDMLSDLYKKLTSTLFAIVFIIGGISLLVGGIGIMNIMLVSVTERTREIGIRKAIGATRSNILTQFLLEAVAISSMGGLIGIIFGYLAGLAVLAQMDITTGVSLTSIMIGFGFSAFVGITAGFYPAYKASKLSPIESLRYDQ